MLCTGIENWNSLCRWALVASLKDPSKPVYVNLSTEGGVEMTWKTFAGDLSPILAGLVKMRATKEGLWGEQEVANLFRQHLHRGLAILAAGKYEKGMLFFLQKNLNL